MSLHQKPFNMETFQGIDLWKFDSFQYPSYGIFIELIQGPASVVQREMRTVNIAEMSAWEVITKKQVRMIGGMK